MVKASVLEYFDIDISRSIPTVSRLGFGTMNFVGTTTGAQADPIAVYGDAAEVQDVFGATAPETFAAQRYFGQQEKPEQLYITIKENAQTYVQAIQAAQDLIDDWYGLAINSRVAADILATSAYAQTQYKLFFPVTADANVPNNLINNDIASQVLGLSYDRTALFYHGGAVPDSDGLSIFPEMAWTGYVLPFEPGTKNWAWKSLAGIPPDETLFKKSLRDTVEAKRATYYTTVGGNNITFAGQVSYPGVYVDLIHFIDWLRFRLAEDFVAKWSASDIHYIGAEAIIESIIRQRLGIAVQNGAIDESTIKVTVPPASQQLITDKADRLYNNVKFECTYTGFVNRVNIRGTVTL